MTRRKSLTLALACTIVALAFVTILLGGPGMAWGNAVGGSVAIPWQPDPRSLAEAGEGRWVWQNPLPQGRGLSSVFFVDAQNGWAVGESGTIIKTTNGGSTWIIEFSGSEQGLSSVFFVDSRTGWAVGNGGAILKTSDGGASWSAQTSGMAQLLRSVDFVDAMTGWVVGDNGTILNTRDGGATWTTQSSGTSNLLESVDFVDAKTGWAVGTYATILHTDDGGVTWNSQACVDCSNLHPRQVVFFDSQTGWIATGGPALRTRDGGSNWSKVSGVSPAVRFSFVDARTGWALSYSSSFIYTFYFVWKTTDGGDTWTRLFYLPGCARKTVPCSLNSVFFADAETGWVVGQLGAIFRTVNGGATWSEQSSAFFRGFVMSVSFVDAMTGWAVGVDHNYGWVLKTGDGGATWIPLSSPPQFRWLYGVDFVNLTTGWVVGDSGEIWKTSDGGATWKAQASGTIHPLLGVAFVDEQTGWAVGQSGILKTADGGETWTAQGPGITNQLDSVFFVDAQKGWATGPFGTILHTSDGGANWHFQQGGNGDGDAGVYPFTSVFFIDAATGWVAQSSGSILKTVDGGSTWKVIYLGPGESPLSVFFLDADNGWVVGAKGLIMRTADGGVTWNRQPWGGGPDLNSVTFVDPRNGWAVGKGGTILRFVPAAPTPVPTPTPSIPNLSVAKLTTRDRVQPGEALAYLIFLDNTGSVPVTVTLTDTIPLGTTIITGTVAGGAVYSPTINSVLWSGAVPPGRSSLPSYVFSFRVAADSSGPTKAVTNTVLVSDGSITTTVSVRTEVLWRSFLPVVLKQATGW
ncbi:MAG: DUF11 domain-containing protein [Chloroflexi bacterium]|nr:DUF11 domain-containing protein [Chloroflexota bacterium]